jgi:glycosyltransferase involved in cell wall biosynthesis
MAKFSVSMSVYKNDLPEYFYLALNSVINQTMPPSEIVLTVDGPVSHELDNIIKRFEDEIKILKTIRLPENKGLGVSRKIGIENCSYELVAVMDSDDLSVKNRFEKQLAVFSENDDIDIVGGYICEFIDTLDNKVGFRYVPLKDSDIKKYFRNRDPINHMTVMFKKASVLKAGNYQDWFLNEDTYLWCRMILTGCKFANIPDVLVYVRVGKAMYKRRGGLKYFINDSKLQKYKLDNKIVNIYDYIVNIFIRFIVQVLLPSTIRSFVFRHFLRRPTLKERK